MNAQKTGSVDCCISKRTNRYSAGFSYELGYQVQHFKMGTDLDFQMYLLFEAISYIFALD